MVDYKKMYLLMFHAATDALEALREQRYDSASAKLITAQQECEELFMSAEEDSDDGLRE